MSKDQLTNEQLNQLRDDLHLKLNSGASLFELNEDESKYRPDDWAWSFLRLSSSYDQSYIAQLDTEDADFSTSLLMPHTIGIKPDHDGTCAEDFGLSAWLPPSVSELPKLRDDKDSWFFPLKRPVAEDYRRLEVSEVTYQRPPWSRSPQRIDEYPHIFANETSMGYREPPSVPIPIFSSPQHGRPRQVKASGSFDVLTLSLVWVAIDCSIPPAGQVAALEDLATRVRSALMNQDWKSRRKVRDVAIADVKNSDAFAHMKFLHASRPARNFDDYACLWRAVMIDSLAPIKVQTKEILDQLTTIHAQLIANKLAQPPRALRFKNTLSFNEKNGDGVSQLSSGGSYLKALVTLGKLARHGYTDPAEVAQIIGLHSPSGHYVGSWARHFHAELEEHITSAIEMANGGYRMLIHEQKPNT